MAPARSTPPAEHSEAEEALRAARTSAKQRLAAKGPLYYVLRGVTALMTLDVWIFGRVRTGPFFVLLERTPTAAQSVQAER